MKNKIVILLTCICLSCSSDDDSPSFDMNLLYGTWYFENLCKPQNNISFDKQGTVIWQYSNNEDCKI